MTKKILVIEDDPETIELLTSRLEANRFEMISASDGEEGLEKVNDDKPDLIILDVMLPKMDGYTFIRELKARKATEKIPVIVLTGKKKMEELFKLEGVEDYIVKPYKINDLLERIQKYLGP